MAKSLVVMYTSNFIENIKVEIPLLILKSDYEK